MKEVALVSSLPIQADSASGSSKTARTFAGIRKCNSSFKCPPRQRRFYPLRE